jgi:O-antigen/teichoic acid export membrane protein
MLRIFLSVIYTIICLIIGGIIGYSLFQLKILSLLIFNQILISFILYLRSNIAGLHLFKTDSILSVLDRLIMIVFAGMLLWGTRETGFPIEWYIYIQSLSYVLTCVIVLAIVIKKAKLRKIHWNTAFFVMILKQSYPYAILVLLMSFYNRIDTVMLERLLPDGATQSGIYAAAYRLLDAANMIAFLFSAILLPMFARMIKYKEPVEELTVLSFSLLAVPALVVSIGSYFYRYELMELLYAQHTEESAIIFGILMFCFTAISMTYIFGTLLTANGNMKQLNMMAAGGMAINILLNFILIPQYKAAGSAFASLITQTLTAMAQILIAQWVFRFRINYRLIGMLAVYIFSCSAAYYLSRLLPFGWIPNFIIAVSASVSMAFLLKIIHLKNLFKMIKSTP